MLLPHDVQVTYKENKKLEINWNMDECNKIVKLKLTRTGCVK